MRDIKFRGYDADSKCWRYGYYFLKEDITLCAIYDSKEQYEKDKENNEHHLILCNGFSDWNMPVPHYQSEVDGESIGQYIGLKDKNGKEIYEGDIIVFDDNTHNNIVEFKNGSRMAKQSRTISSYIGQGYCNWEKIVEVIGNIYENPELIKGGE